ncbi:hypothetical protein I3843_10G043200 [Carya illinoinensis]|uniref:Alpha/beta hydrolase fold-3 domain-containing protein n=1 Tax=Carya illinoinensis TaxID=32201 RepID=A0A8T1P3X9_CARIL|nr:hypothetical protein CIPAW_10G043300 [Carya illinoinensis]KAG6691004.1 hypothetical protein I3842_10G042500 [Carya illinoinensis]KAG7958901.1 hypothetical protein I3843_10G043200 [Carya illinoinensis]
MAPNQPIVKEVTGWLRVFADGTTDRTWTGPPHRGFIDGVATHNVVIDTNSSVAVRIYIPEKNMIDTQDKNKLPLLLQFHGGDFCISRADWFMYYHFYACLVRTARAVCVSVYLPLAPEHKLPAACDEAYADFLFLVGDSTCGNLVHQLAARAGDTNTDPVHLSSGILLHPGFLRAEPSKSFLETPEMPLLTREMVNKFISLALPVGSTKDHPITCPMGSLNDLLRDLELEYCEAMEAAGKDVEVSMNRGMGHNFYFNKLAIDMDPESAAQADKLIEAITNFISRH